MKKKIFRLLCNPITGKIISLLFNYNIPNCKYGFKRYKTPPNYCSDTVRAMIFFGFYEGAEMRMIRKYLPKNIPVIELGSSLGIVSSTAITYLDVDTLYTCIEANPYLKQYIELNIKKHNPFKVKFNVISTAIAYNTNGYIDMCISKNNTESSIIENTESLNINTTKVKASTLNEIVTDSYTLICDIEGAEIQLLKNDAAALAKCKHLFIELHKTSYKNIVFEIADLKKLIIEELNFKFIIADGNVYYFQK